MGEKEAVVSRYVEFALPDGSTVVIESDEPETGITKAAVRGVGEVTERARETFEQSAENARKSALVILDKVRHGLSDPPDEVEITFGLKASGELGSMVVAKVGVEASYSVTLTWKKEKAKRGAAARS
jgi:hypothetical protein